MNLITQRDRIRGAAANWRRQYPGERKKYNQLRALDTETATAEQVAAIISNTSWTSLTCDECEQEVTTVVEGRAEPYGRSPATVCADCLRQAVALLPQ